MNVMTGSKTIQYYNQNAQQYMKDTVAVNFSDTQERFLAKLDPGSYLLDYGCGSGRDTKYFLDRGYRVDAIDGSEEFCRSASLFTGIHVKQMLFQDLDLKEQYDGIWACASILHLPKKELLPVLLKMYRALKCNGIIYSSFKYGAFEGERNGRYFTDFTEETFDRFLSKVQTFKIEEQWITSDVRTNRGAEKWLNLILRKQDVN